MARQAGNNQMYNPEIKEEYLSTLDENTAKIYRFAFYRSYGTESILDRDLYTFSTDEIVDALEAANHSTLPSIRLTYNVFKSYLEWAVKYSNSNINVMDSLKTSDLKKYLNTSKIYFSYDELEDMLGQLVNYQDKVVLRAVFEGVYGYEGSELLSLTLNDIRKNKVRLNDEKQGERYINVSDELISLFERAEKETEYLNKNGLSEGRFEKSYLMDNGYVIKGANRNKAIEGKANRNILYNRFKMMKEYFGADYLTPNNIRKSGMIYMAYVMLKRDGKLENEQLAEIAKHYGIKSVMNNGYEVYNYSLIREYVNMDNIKELYDIEA